MSHLSDNLGRTIKMSDYWDVYQVIRTPKKYIWKLLFYPYSSKSLTLAKLKNELI